MSSSPIETEHVLWVSISFTQASPPSQHVNDVTDIVHNMSVIFDPIDNFIQKHIARHVTPFFCMTGHSSYMISWYSRITCFASLYFLMEDDIARFSLYYCLSYVLRSTASSCRNFFSEQEDHDHGYITFRSSILVAGTSRPFCHVLLLLTIISKWNNTLPSWWYMWIINGIITTMHVGCSQLLIYVPHSPMTIMCPSIEAFTYLRYWGIGVSTTVNVIMVVFIACGVAMGLKIILLTCLFVYFHFKCEKCKNQLICVNRFIEVPDDEGNDADTEDNCEDI